MNKTTDWIWDGEGSIGCFSLGASVTELLPHLDKLERYEYENYDTYMINDSNWSKIFVQEEVIISIQCALHFVANDVDLIGKTIQDCDNILNIQFFVNQVWDYTTNYINKEKTIKLIENGKFVQYVILSSLWK